MASVWDARYAPYPNGRLHRRQAWAPDEVKDVSNGNEAKEDFHTELSTQNGARTLSTSPRCEKGNVKWEGS